MSVEVWEARLLDIVSVDNHRRRLAEEEVLKTMAADPEACVAAMIQLIQPRVPSEVIQLAAVILRQMFLKQDHFDRLGIHCRRSLQQLFRQLMFSRDFHPVLYRRVSDAFAVLARRCCTEWPELIQLLDELGKSSDKMHRQAMLSAIDALAEFQISFLYPYVESLLPFLIEFVNDQSAEVLVSAIRALTSIFLSMKSEDSYKFSYLVPFIFKSISGIQDEFLSKNVFECLSGLAEKHPLFFNPFLKSIVETLCPFVNSQDLDLSVRRQHLEFLLALCQYLPRDSSCDSTLATLIIPCAFRLITEHVVEDGIWILQQDEDSVLHDGTNALETLVRSLGTSTVVPVSMHFIRELLQPRSPHVFAGLHSLEALIETGAEYWECNPQELLLIVLLHCSSQAPSVRYATLSCLCAFASAFPDSLASSSEILSILSFVLDTLCASKCFGITAKALEFFSMFVDGQCFSDFGDFPTKLMNVLMALLQNHNEDVLKAAINCAGDVSNFYSDDNGVYFSNFFPPILNYLQQHPSAEIRSSCLSSLALIGFNTKIDLFMPHAIGLLELCKEWLTVHSDDSDIKMEVFRCVATVASKLHDKFSPYLHIFVPHLVQAAAMDPECSISDVELFNNDSRTEGNEKTLSFTFNMRSIGDKRVSMNTSLLMEKQSFCQSLFQLLENLGGLFGPYLEQTADVLFPLVLFPFSYVIQSIAFKSIPSCMKSAQESRDEYRRDQFFSRGFPILLHGLVRHQADVVPEVLNSMTQALELLGSSLPPDLAIATLMSLQKIVNESQQRARNSKAAATSQEELEIISSVSDCLEKLSQYSGSDFVLRFHDILFPQITTFLSEQFYPDFTALALSVMGYVIEFGGENGFAYIESMLPLFIHYSDMKHAPNLRQAALFGIGVCSQRFGNGFSKFSSSAIHVVVQNLSHIEARSDEHGFATDNAILSLGKMLVFQATCCPVDKLLPLWISQLPLQHDVSEWFNVTTLLLELYSRHISWFSAQSDLDLLAKLLGIIGSTLSSDSEQAASLSKLCADTTLSIRQIMGPQAFASVLSTLEEDDARSLRELTG